MFNAITLFSGGGIVDIGLKAANFEIVGAVERDEAIASVYTANHGDHMINAPVEEVDYRQFYGIDLLHASPPCQHFSLARNKFLPAHVDADAGLSVIKAVRDSSFQLR